jgi:hypothetical protein
MLHEIKEIRVEAAYRLRVRFADGVEGIVDASALIGHGIFKSLVDDTAFARASVDRFGAVCWPSGADLAPDAIHAALRQHGLWRPSLASAPQPASAA